MASVVHVVDLVNCGETVSRSQVGVGWSASSCPGDEKGVVTLGNRWSRSQDALVDVLSAVCVIVSAICG